MNRVREYQGDPPHGGMVSYYEFDEGDNCLRCGKLAAAFGDLGEGIVAEDELCVEPCDCRLNEVCKNCKRASKMSADAYDAAEEER